jgi:serine phosphatase RsbU (regulator of sigma subunit)/anti-sigma regulatory factor (Ser/Thr protein kinase)
MNNKKSLEINRKIYHKNEIDANKELAKGCIFSALVVILVWILYLVRVFKVSNHTFLLVSVLFPILIVAFGSTYFYTKTKIIEKPGFKYFLIIQFIIGVFALNIIIPKHGILMWATCIVLVNHYYDPKLSLCTFILVALLMFIAIYAGMFLGEWDSNLLNGAEDITVYDYDGKTIIRQFNSDSSTFEDRKAWLDYLRDVKGDNRYAKVFTYYYLPRVLILLIISNIAFGVSRRSLRLLSKEAGLLEEKHRQDSELKVATDIQYSVLPKELEDDNKDNIFGLMDPAKEVGGDFFDYFYIDETHLALVMADVSGKGVPAALFMMKTETLIKSLTLALKSDTATIMKRANQALCSNNDANIFVTCWLGIINLATGEIRFTNAGHNKIIIFSDGNEFYSKDKPGVVLGAFAESKYTENKIVLNNKDKILLYTDGVTEAHNSHNELYGEARLLAFAKKNRDLSPKLFVNSLRTDIDIYAENAKQFDDITILMFNYDNENMVSESRTFPADVKELDNLFYYSSSLLKLLDFSNRDIIMINTALEEVFVNVAKYAYENTGTVEITLSKFRDHITFVFKDRGVPFNPLDKEDPNINASSEDREIGGLGIFMVKKIMDKVTYEYANNENILTLVKYKKNEE